MPVVLDAESLCTPLVSVDDFRAWKNSGSNDAADTTDDEAIIARALCAATAWLESDQGCGRSFTLETGVTKVFLPFQNGKVDVPDLVGVPTTIKLDTSGNLTYATTLATTDYVLYPYNAGRYQEVRSSPTAVSTILAGQYVQIVGDFGYTVNGQVPAMIQQACLILTGRYFARRSSPFGVLELPMIGRLTSLPPLDPDVEQLIAPYRAGNLWVWV